MLPARPRRSLRSRKNSVSELSSSSASLTSSGETLITISRFTRGSLLSEGPDTHVRGIRAKRLTRALQIRISRDAASRKPLWIALFLRFQELLRGRSYEAQMASARRELPALEPRIYAAFAPRSVLDLEYPSRYSFC